MKKSTIICKNCGVEFVVSHDVTDNTQPGVSRPERCPSCRALHAKHISSMGVTYWVKVEGSDATEVQKVSLALMEKSSMKPTHKRPNPWVSGSFYLTVFIVVIVTLLVIAQRLPPLLFPIVLVGGILALSLIGAFQLRQDSQLSQRNFLELMALTFRYLPWLKKQK